MYVSKLFLGSTKYLYVEWCLNESVSKWKVQSHPHFIMECNLYAIYTIWWIHRHTIKTKSKCYSHFYRFSQMLDKMQQNDKREMILNRNNHKITSMLSNFWYDKSGYVAKS